MKLSVKIFRVTRGRPNKSHWPSESRSVGQSVTSGYSSLERELLLVLYFVVGLRLGRTKPRPTRTTDEGTIMRISIVEISTYKSKRSSYNEELPILMTQGTTSSEFSDSFIGSLKLNFYYWMQRQGVFAVKTISVSLSNGH